MKKSHASLLFLVLVFCLFLWMMIQAQTFQETASYFPFYIALLAGILTVVATIKQIVTLKKAKDEELFHENFMNVLKYVGWIVSYIVLIYVVGFVPASMIYLFVFLLLEARMSILKCLLSTGATAVVIIAMSRFMDLKWPSSLLTFF
ncbi:tripartite tricarboxylate transporter TctB family protein [Halalkalibacter alkaliphilus]|uniref:Tripartite tricarboxylate transporter TctB family protein n=1 Tax=Halalkalibacter alkaliphilus TaxID=2917993 RepID=A0A9X2CR89_9BACI|nr:tripartite tricarboxylate transporter TctB family protein [Halalkalibacter alkaliphilus]MCL7745499.1 tripartite tricarboxylate transporter TctB family protein [Halalkalibacter alkaliphilus]